MKIRTSLIAAACSLAFVAAIAAPAGAATPPINVATDKLQCDSVVGTIKFSPTLVNGGTAPGTSAVKAAVEGCTDLTNSSVSIYSGAAAGTISSATNDCGGLLGLSTASSGTLTTKWKVVAHTSKITPAATDLAVTQTNGTTFSGATWTNSGYGEFQIGTAYGTTAPSITGTNDAFAGTNSGHTSIVDATTGQSTTAAAETCLLGGGIKELNFGIGGLTLQ